MAASVGYVLAQLQRWTSPRLGELPDAVLLERFRQQRDEAAFAALVARHGEMVLRSCRRILGDVHEAEDAFQATFLILARKAHTLRQADALPGFLHSVARRVALKARAKVPGFTRNTSPSEQLPDAHAGPPTQLTARELLDIVDEEVNRLPAAQRSVVILCYLEGRTREEAARISGCTEMAIKGHLQRGRQRLQKRLERRGITLSAALALVCVSRGETVPALLLQSTVKAALGGGISGSAAALAQSVLISPALANATLDGLETLLHERFGATQRQRSRNKVHLVRYADDFLITGTSAQLLHEEVQPLVAHFLQERGLELSHEKTKISRVEDGFDFLGQHVRRFGTKVLLKPSAKNVRALLDKVDKFLQGEGGHLPVGLLIAQLNLILRGWANYHRHASSTRTFARVDSLIFRKLWRWARRRHATKGSRWVRAKYFTQRGANRWVFHGQVVDSQGQERPIYLYKTAETGIRRHIQVRGDANPYDPAWELYFEERLSARMAQELSGRKAVQRLWKHQGGKCPVCEQELTLTESWHLHHKEWRVYGGSDALFNRRLLHANCHRQVHSQGLEIE